jgi:hypothetical protein
MTPTCHPYVREITHPDGDPARRWRLTLPDGCMAYFPTRAEAEAKLVAILEESRVPEEGILDKIDDLLDRWRKGGTGMTLHEYLGMTWDQYRAWLTSAIVPEGYVLPDRPGPRLTPAGGGP